MTEARAEENIEIDAPEVMLDEADALAAEEPELDAFEAELDEALLELEIELEVVLERLVDVVPLEALMLVYEPVLSVYL